MPPTKASDVDTTGMERIVVASVALTARALAEESPELTLLQWRVLVLADQPGGVGIGAIAAAVGSKMAAMSRLIGRLRARGLVQTRRGEGDARLVLVTLTARRPGAARNGSFVVARAELKAALAAADLSTEVALAIDQIASALEAGALEAGAPET